MGRTPSRLLSEIAIGVGLFCLGLLVCGLVLHIADTLAPFGDVRR